MSIILIMVGLFFVYIALFEIPEYRLGEGIVCTIIGILALCAGVISLSNSGEAVKEQTPQVVEWRDYATDYENQVFTTVLHLNTDCSTGIYKLTEEAIINRGEKPDESQSFVDIMETIKLDNIIPCTTNGLQITTVNHVIQTTKGITLEEFVQQNQDKVVVETIEEVEPLVEESAEVQAIPVVNTSFGEDILAPDLIDSVIEAVQTCNRAKLTLINLTEEKDYLTRDDYKVVMGQITKCKTFKLQVELNK